MFCLDCRRAATELFSVTDGWEAPEALRGFNGDIYVEWYEAEPDVRGLKGWEEERGWGFKWSILLNEKTVSEIWYEKN